MFDLPVSPRLQSCAKGKKVAAKMKKSFKGSKKEQMYIVSNSSFDKVTSPYPPSGGSEVVYFDVSFCVSLSTETG